MLSPPDIDPAAVRQQFSRRARHAPRADFLLREVESRMLERLPLVRLAPKRIVDVGCGRGEGLLALKRQYPEAALIGVDSSFAAVRRASESLAAPSRGFFARMLRADSSPLAGLVAGDAHALPLANGSVDLVWSNLALHWFESPQNAIDEWYRVMRPGALLDFSFFGVDTFMELRALGARTMSFHDMHDIGDALMESGFSEPVMDMQRVTLSWKTPQALLDDAHALGGNALRNRFRGLLGRRSRDEWLHAIESLRGSDGLIRCTVEIVFGHAWCPQRKRRSDGLASIEFQPRRRDVDAG
ncbi:MAG: methyltransferase domain-containing protein [Burkholderiaceae bacterium]|jgi:malonyl-CoA O-methyltransferase|nr:methyltransferase domain-containing protein [Burkholderiaceae bacterium]